jgi:transcriptional regulator with XRE-family HTH domain
MPLTYAQRKRAIARRLVQLRRRKGISQRKLARLSGICQSKISRFERAERMPDLHDLSELARAMGEVVEILLPTEDPGPPPRGVRKTVTAL